MLTREEVQMRRMGELEAAVMKVMWDLDGPMTVREVHGQLSSRRLAYTTQLWPASSKQ